MTTTSYYRYRGDNDITAVIEAVMIPQTRQFELPTTVNGWTTEGTPPLGSLLPFRPRPVPFDDLLAPVRPRRVRMSRRLAVRRLVALAAPAASAAAVWFIR